jgi:16S rRNA (guanine527-N7)-methyltransferase
MQTEWGKVLDDAGFACAPQVLDKLTSYYQLLIAWNKKTNLTALTEPGAFIYKHILDSLYPARYLRAGTLVDVGTGAGFPGLPLKLFLPQLQLTLVEASTKKIAFLEHCLTTLAIEAKIYHGRAEELGRTIHREGFSFATTRAVATLSVICEYCLPLLTLGGTLLALKGPGGAEEIKSAAIAIDLLGGAVGDVIHYQLPNGDQRTLVLIKKVLPTPERFPRRAGIPAKKPIG